MKDEIAAILAAEKAEWEKWRAKETIFIDGVRAFNVGSAVPASHVEKFDLQDKVEPADAPPEVRAPVSPVKPPKGDDIAIKP